MTIFPSFAASVEYWALRTWHFERPTGILGAVIVVLSTSISAFGTRHKNRSGNQTGQPELVAASDGSLTVTVPIRIKRRGLRKTMTLPAGGVEPRPWDVTPTPLQLALARGHRWLAMLESGEVRSLKEIARREGVDDSYVSRMVNLTTLAPDIVAAILDETLPPEVTLFELGAVTPLVWEEQWGRVRGNGER